MSNLVVGVLIDHPLQNLCCPKHPLVDLVIGVLLGGLQQPPPHGLHLLLLLLHLLLLGHLLGGLVGHVAVVDDPLVDRLAEVCPGRRLRLHVATLATTVMSRVRSSEILSILVSR